MTTTVPAGPLGVLLAFALAPAVARADDLTGATLMLCSPVKANMCTAVGDCESRFPWDLNIPPFVKIDLERQTISTTPANPQDRTTALQTVVREAGIIVLQGEEAERAYSFMIVEETGLFTVAVARDGRAVNVFGACTPLDGGDE